MSGDINLGHYLDMALGGIGNDAAQVIVRVMLAAGQAGVALDVDAPALVVGEVQLQHVVLILGHLVDEELDILHGKEVAGGVEHEGAAGKTRSIVDDDGRHLITGGGTHVAQEELVEGGGGAVEGLNRATKQSDAAVRHLETVVLGALQSGIDGQGDAAFAGLCRQGDGYIGTALDAVRYGLGDRGERVGGTVDGGAACFDTEGLTLGQLHVVGHGDKGRKVVLCGHGAGYEERQREGHSKAACKGTKG